MKITFSSYFALVERLLFPIRQFSTCSFSNRAGFLSVCELHFTFAQHLVLYFPVWNWHRMQNACEKLKSGDVTNKLTWVVIGFEPVRELERSLGAGTNDTCRRVNYSFFLSSTGRCFSRDCPGSWRTGLVLAWPLPPPTRLHLFVHAGIGGSSVVFHPPQANGHTFSFSFHINLTPLLSRRHFVTQFVSLFPFSLSSSVLSF